VNENVPTFRSGKVTVLGKTRFSYAESQELRLLLGQIGKTGALAADSLGATGKSIVGASVQDVMEMTTRLEVLIGRARQILG
jgi:hypothetical protein